MSDQTPSQAEGEREEAETRNRTDGPAPERTTPSQAEGERDEAPDASDADGTDSADGAGGDGESTGA
ncbi:hypothetical protein OG885_42015 [Streptomyces sp. NBC_00028]|uniref:hypothetical protein n=1 Tax=Streptomyces sp. NBC_00028 TaxID=2975624 RepID=UPI0032563A70